MNKFFKFLSGLVVFGLSFTNVSAVKLRISNKNFSFILDTKKQTAELCKVYSDSDDNITLDIPSFVDFCNSFYRVIGLTDGCIDRYVFERINSVNIPYTIEKNENNRKIFFKLLSAPKMTNFDKLVIRDFFEDFATTQIDEKLKNAPIK